MFSTNNYQHGKAGRLEGDMKTFCYYTDVETFTLHNAVWMNGRVIGEVPLTIILPRSQTKTMVLSVGPVSLQEYADGHGGMPVAPTLFGGFHDGRTEKDVECPSQETRHAANVR